jgi:hypothetical protein
MSVVAHTGNTITRNGNIEVLVYFLNRNKYIPSEKWKMLNGHFIYKVPVWNPETKRKFRYGIPAYTGPFRTALDNTHSFPLEWRVREAPVA